MKIEKFRSLYSSVRVFLYFYLFVSGICEICGCFLFSVFFRGLIFPWPKNVRRKSRLALKCAPPLKSQDSAAQKCAPMRPAVHTPITKTSFLVQKQRSAAKTGTGTFCPKGRLYLSPLSCANNVAHHVILSAVKDLVVRLRLISGVVILVPVRHFQIWGFRIPLCRGWVSR